MERGVGSGRSIRRQMRKQKLKLKLKLAVRARRKTVVVDHSGGGFPSLLYLVSSHSLAPTPHLTFSPADAPRTGCRGYFTTRNSGAFCCGQLFGSGGTELEPVQRHVAPWQLSLQPFAPAGGGSGGDERGTAPVHLPLLAPEVTIRSRARGGSCPG